MNRNRKRQQKGPTIMPTQAAPALLSVVPDSQTQKEIENTLDAPRKISDAIEDLEKERSDARADLARSIAADLAAGPLNIDSAIEKQKAWKTKDDTLAAKIQACDQLREIIAARIEELKATQPAALAAALQRKVDELEKESATQKDRAALLKKQIDEFKALLSELEKSEKKEQAAAKKT
jgi:hypothetical protein